MTDSHASQGSEKTRSMAEADTANGEAVETNESETRSDPDDHPVEHPTGKRQAQENKENDPPA